VNPGHGKPDPGHLGKIRPLAAEERLHVAVAIGLAITEKINKAL